MSSRKAETFSSRAAENKQISDLRLIQVKVRRVIQGDSKPADRDG
jgi:hypothetical protein